MAQFYSAKRRVTTRQIITVEATDLDPFGQGVARHNGKALFITGLLPTERAEITLTEDKRQFARGQVKRRLNDSPERVKLPTFWRLRGLPATACEHRITAKKQKPRAGASA